MRENRVHWAAGARGARDDGRRDRVGWVDRAHMYHKLFTEESEILRMADSSGGELMRLLADGGLGHVAQQLAVSLTLAECFSLLDGGRPALLSRLKEAGVTLITDRQRAAKVLAEAKRDPLQYRRALPLPPPPPPSSAVNALPPRIMPPSASRAQPGCFQDIRALQFLGFPSNGYYVEVGVADATYHNNTWLLDDELGWRGLLCDPLVTNIEKRTKSGRAVWFGVALGKRSGNAAFSVGGAWSGLTEFTTSAEHNAKWHSMARSWQTTDVLTRTPLEVLEAAGTPRTIDYLSLDAMERRSNSGASAISRSSGLQ